MRIFRLLLYLLALPPLAACDDAAFDKFDSAIEDLLVLITQAQLIRGFNKECSGNEKCQILVEDQAPACSVMALRVLQAGLERDASRDFVALVMSSTLYRCVRTPNGKTLIDEMREARREGREPILSRASGAPTS